MKNVKKWISMAVVIAVAGSIIGCSSGSSGGASSSAVSASQQSTETSEEATTEAAAEASEAEEEESEVSGVTEPVDLIIASASASGGYYQWCVPAANIMTTYCDNITVTPISTAGGAENLQLMGAQEAQLGGTLDITCYFAYSGQGPWEAAGAVDNIRIFASNYPYYVQFLAPGDTDIETIDDLRGKRVVVGLQDSSDHNFIRLVFGAIGIAENDDYTPLFMSISDGVAAIQEGTADAMLINQSIGAAAAMELAASRTGLRLVPFTEEQIDSIVGVVPFLRRDVIPADSYAGVDYETLTLGASTMVCITDDVPEEVAYEIAKALEEHHDELAAALPVAEYTSMEHTVRDFWGQPIPFHPGIERYARELGLIND